MVSGREALEEVISPDVFWGGVWPWGALGTVGRRDGHVQGRARAWGPRGPWGAVFGGRASTVIFGSLLWFTCGDKAGSRAQALLEGPVGSEVQRGLLSLLPRGAFFPGEVVVGSGALPDLGGERGRPGVCTHCSHTALASLPVLVSHSLGGLCFVLPVTLSVPGLAWRGGFRALPSGGAWV